MSAATASSIATDFDLGPIDQISFAVTSVEQSLPWYAAVFGGPSLEHLREHGDDRGHRSGRRTDRHANQ
jgi:hypothetical protein